jgi:serine phosphatase RsbU (regulator of sigma subunit)/Tfp pilus assembly protein PilF
MNLRRILTLYFFFLLSCAALFSQSKKDSLLALLKKQIPDTEKVKVLVKLSGLHRWTDNPAAEKFGKEAIELATKTGFQQGLANAYSAYGVSLGDQGKLEEERTWHEKSLAISQKLGDKKNQGKSLNNISVVLYTLGSYKEAVEYSLLAVEVYAEINDKWGLALTYMTLGNISLEQKFSNQALKYYEEGLKANRESVKDEKMEARLLANIGNVYNSKKENEKSLDYYSQALGVFEKYGMKHEVAILLNNIGTVLQNQEKTAEGLSYFRRSLDMRLQINDSDGVCTAFQNIASAMNELGKLDSSVYYYMKALDLAKRMLSKGQEASIYLGLADTYAKRKEFSAAYTYVKHYVTLNDSILGTENANAINDLKTKYEEQKHARKIEQLESSRQLEKERSQLKIVLLVVGILLLALLAFIFYTRVKRKQQVNVQLEKKNLEITLQKKAITDSINYAKRIQDSILPSEAHVNRILPDNFVLYLPKDVVSGDFYWVEEKNNKAVFAAVDCTGHGVPGALMSVVGFNLLSQAVNEMGLTKPSEILQHLDHGVKKLLRQAEGEHAVKDGMDLSLCALDLQTRLLHYSGVFNPAYIIQDGKLVQLKADKFSIGDSEEGASHKYTNHEMQLKKGDMIYLFSDGYADQFGGVSGKKFMYKNFRKLLLEIHSLPVNQQKQKLSETLKNWIGTLEQVDDVLVIGVRV